MREQMRIEGPNHGPLLDSMLITDGRVPTSADPPRVEAEIAIVLGRTCTQSKRVRPSNWLWDAKRSGLVR
ncbi:MAG: hypothetical protein JOY78_01785 [Pseudonocardia sp.]|nr:hypothetical protein [Pseudonocardia sp.]